ncbi:MAG: response regulator, partial [candidate division KSB1 bacterium]|nr:response regulator [candidate division KSB1 bacterium]
YLRLRGKEALNYPKQDLYIVDLGLPGMNGMETLAALKARFGEKVHAILITGYNPDTDERILREHGIFQVLQKPFNIDVLKKEIAAFFESQPPADPIVNKS